MRIRKYLAPVLTVAALGGLGFAAYQTHELWMPYVFPEKAAAKAEGKHDPDHEEAPTDRVKLSEQAQKNLGLKSESLTPREYTRTVVVPGIVVDRPGETDRRVTSRVPGVVTAIDARPGDLVYPGDTLFKLQLASEFLQKAQTDLAHTAKEFAFAILERDRISNLVERGTIPKSELMKQQNVVDKLTTQRDGYRRQLLVFGLSDEQVDRAEHGDVITEVVVVAPVRGSSFWSRLQPDSNTPYEIHELKVTLGDQVAAGQALCLLVNHQRLYVEGWAFKTEADALADAAEHGTPIHVEFLDERPGNWPTQGPLTIHHLSHQVDPTSRTFSFFLTLENQSRTFDRENKPHPVWRYWPGQRARLRLPAEKLVTLAADGKTEQLPFVVPAGAMVREGPEAFVFVQLGDVFRRKSVRVLYEDRQEVVIANDGSVTEADLVVMNQAAALNRALKAATAGGGEEHHHDH